MTTELTERYLLTNTYLSVAIAVFSFHVWGSLLYLMIGTIFGWEGSLFLPWQLTTCTVALGLTMFLLRWAVRKGVARKSEYRCNAVRRRR